VTGIEPVLDIDEFVHEVRAPLASATFALAALGEDPKALVILEDALDHLRDLITTSSRQVNGPTDVQEHLMRAIRLIDGHQRVDVSLTIGEAVFVQAAPVQFRQLVINLVSNALKFSPTTSTVAVTVTAQNGMLEVNVADQGCGLNADDATLIFENGVRGESSNQIDGSGLGLAIARRLARLAGGDVHLTRTGPEGSVFTVSLPVIK
jgi:signal transduction histidine kinase